MANVLVMILKSFLPLAALLIVACGEKESVNDQQDQVVNESAMTAEQPSHTAKADTSKAGPASSTAIDPSLFQENGLNPEIDERFSNEPSNQLPDLFENSGEDSRISAGGKVLTKKNQPFQGMDNLSEHVNGAEFQVEIKTN